MSVDMDCTAGSANNAPIVTFSLGDNALGTQRRVKGGESRQGTAYISYNLFSDSGRTIPFTASTNVSTSTVTSGVSCSATIYGRVPASGSYQLGNYSDTVKVVVTYSTTAVLLSG